MLSGQQRVLIGVVAGRLVTRTIRSYIYIPCTLCFRVRERERTSSKDISPGRRTTKTVLVPSYRWIYACVQHSRDGYADTQATAHIWSGRHDATTPPAWARTQHTQARVDGEERKEKLKGGDRHWKPCMSVRCGDVWGVHWLAAHFDGHPFFRTWWTVVGGGNREAIDWLLSSRVEWRGEVLLGPPESQLAYEPCINSIGAVCDRWSMDGFQKLKPI